MGTCRGWFQRCHRSLASNCPRRRRRSGSGARGWGLGVSSFHNYFTLPIGLRSGRGAIVAGMRQTPATLAILALLFTAAGCVTTGSISPHYTEKRTVFEPALLGTWTNEDGEERWTFTK